MAMKIGIVGKGRQWEKAESEIWWSILQMQGLFTGQDAIKAVNEKLGSDYSERCWKVLDKLLETPLLEYTGQDKEGKTIYKVNL